MLQSAVNLLNKKLSFRFRILLLLASVAIIQLLFVGYCFYQALMETLENQVGARALVLAREIAIDPELVHALGANDKLSVQQYINGLLPLTDADYIVIGDKNEIRITHPNPSKVGMKMVGGDSTRALIKGEHYYTMTEGSMGLAIRGKAPIISVEGEIIGIISVGYLLDQVNSWFMFYLEPVLIGLLLTLFISWFCAWFFSIHIKTQMYGMEPEEIALSLRLQKSVLQAVYEGIIAIDNNACIITVNKTALNILGIANSPEYYKGKHVNEIATPTTFLIANSELGNVSDEVISLNGETLIANRTIIENNQQQSGWVISFRLRNDINMLTTQLSQIQQHSENLRLLCHEHANKLSTIGGFIQIGEYDKAIESITSYNNNQQQFIDYITNTFHCRVIAGLMIGKYSRAQELGLSLEFDDTCHLHNPPGSMPSDKLAAILSNLLDNAFEATLKNPQSNKKISLLITDSGSDLVIEVADNGTGIDSAISDSIFIKGATSKEQPGHGIGLYLVHRYVTNAGGCIFVDNADPSGAIFSLFIPHKRS